MLFSGDVFLVTGGAGFIGSAVIRYLLAETHASVVIVDKLTYAACLASVPLAVGNPRYRFAQEDICDGAAMRRLFEEYQPRYIMHLAAETHVDRSIDNPRNFIETNIVGTFTLLQAALFFWRGLDEERQRRFRFHHVSTDEVYGSLGPEGLFTEKSAYAPTSPYSASKAASDHLVRSWGATYGLPTLITNCSNNYGPYHFPEKLIPLMIIRALAEEPLPVYGDGRNVRDWLYVDDHARALALVIEKGSVGETYNIGGRNERSNLDVVTVICRILDDLKPSSQGPRKRLITFVRDRPGHDIRYAIDASKVQNELDWTPRETFETGIVKTVRWYCENESWWRDILKRGYQPVRSGLD